MTVVALALLAVLAGAPAPGPGLDGGTPRSSGSRLTFHGWSPDSRLVAYTRYRLGKRGAPQSEQRVQRFVTDGAFAGFGRMVGGDVERYAAAHGYVATPAPRRQLDRAECTARVHADGAAGPAEPAARAADGALRANCWELRLGERTFVLDFDVGDEIGWRLFEGPRELARHAFDRIYVAFDPDLYAAPNGRQAVLVVHLDTGWDTDAAVYPVSLVPPE